MRFAGGLVKHLGLQMYSGAVPSIAELIANSWDADSTRVNVAFPLNQHFDSKSKIEVKDNGSGMTFDECDKKYLVLGRDRREDEGQRTSEGRRVLAHKGIGKLAGFGIAREVTIRTVKDGRLTCFGMNFDEIQKNKFGGEYNPKIIEDNRTTEANGTSIILTGIKLSRVVNEDQFIESMKRRFSLLSDTFEVFINGKKLTKFDVPLQFRFPNEEDSKEGTKIVNTWGLDTIDGKEIKWWIGFTENPIHNEESMGLSVLVRGKLAQDPWFFESVGGGHGQLGLRYMVGEVMADFLDDEEDLIATDRASILWSHPKAEGLKQWGKDKVKKYLSKWVLYRTRQNEALAEEDQEIHNSLITLPDGVREPAAEAVKRISEIPTLTRSEVLDFSTFMVDAFQNKHYLKLIHQINTAPAEDKQKIIKLVSEWSIVDAVCLSIVIKGRIGHIENLEKLTKREAKEKPDMHDLLMENPWLIEPGMDYYRHEYTLDKLLLDEYGNDIQNDEEGRKRPDFFCLISSRQVRIVEIKRPGLTASKKELRQIQDYVHYLRQNANSVSEPRYHLDIEGILIASEIDSKQTSFVQSLAETGIYVWDWNLVIRRAKDLYKEYFELILRRGPANNPVIRALSQQM
jgi:hypothetical protein